MISVTSAMIYYRILPNYVDELYKKTGSVFAIDPVKLHEIATAAVLRPLGVRWAIQLQQDGIVVFLHVGVHRAGDDDIAVVPAPGFDPRIGQNGTEGRSSMALSLA